MTVRKLDGLVAANEQRAQRALTALLKEAQVPCKCSASAAAAAAALRTSSPELGYRGGGGGACGGSDELTSGLSSNRRARGLLPEDDDAAAAGGRRRGASSRRRSKAPDGGGKSLPGKLALLKSAATSIMAANAVQRVFGGAGEPPAEELRASSSLLEREADANLGEADGGGGGGDASGGPPVGPPRTPESLIC